MAKKVLIINNGSMKREPYIINSIRNYKSLIVEVIHNYVDFKKYSLVERVYNKLRLPLDLNEFNNRIIEFSRSFNPDYIFIIKGNNIFFKTLNILKKLNNNIKLISWSADNMIKKHNTSIYFERSIKIYDIHFTTKSNIINELYKRGAQKVVFLDKAYCKKNHFPENFDEKFSFEVLFIGSYEKERYNTLKYLSRNNIKINVFGDMWKNTKSLRNLIIHKRALKGVYYRKAISSSKINLCFLRKINDDLQTSRSIEIPACNGFMIAEDTIEHRRLFKENHEAVFFKSDEELLKKIKYYLKNNVARNKIKNAGFKRVQRCNYTYDNMVEIIFKSL